MIELGLWSCVVFQLGFGLAPSFEAALLMRFLMGMCNGIIGVAKATTGPPELAPHRGCNPMPPGLQPYASQAAAPRLPGCSPTPPRRGCPSSCLPTASRWPCLSSPACGASGRWPGGGLKGSIEALEALEYSTQ